MLTSLPCHICGIKRLKILENAITHYSGGIFSLELRVLDSLHRLKDSCPEVAKTLTDIAHYLHDIIEVGELNEIFSYCSDRSCNDLLK